MKRKKRKRTTFKSQSIYYVDAVFLSKQASDLFKVRCRATGNHPTLASRMTCKCGRRYRHNHMQLGG